MSGKAAIVRRWLADAGRRGVRLPWGLLGMIVLAALAERFVARAALDFLDVDDWAFRETHRATTREAQRGEILVFGDSLVKLGVVPKAVEERTGRRTYNLALSGGQATTSLAVFRQALAGGARPEAVVVDFFPTLQSVGPRHTLGSWASLLGPTEAAGLAWRAGDGGLFGSIALARLLPSLKGRAAIRANLRSALDGKDDIRRSSNALARRNWSRNAGAQLMPPPAEGVRLTDAAADTWRHRYFETFRIEPVNADAIARFLSLAAEKRVRVYWLLPPYVPALQAKLQASGFDATHRTFVRSWQERFPNLTVIDGQFAVPDPGAYYDPHHLAARGAYGFSLALGETLRHTLPGDAASASAPPTGPPPGRWVAVPECGPRPVPPGLEDFDASKVALEAYRDRNRR